MVTMIVTGREAELLQAGWRKQTTIDEPRLSELVENYRSLGYEVLVDAWRTAGDDCHECLDAGVAMGQGVGTIYIRGDGGSMGELGDWPLVEAGGR